MRRRRAAEEGEGNREGEVVEDIWSLWVYLDRLFENGSASYVFVGWDEEKD